MVDPQDKSLWKKDLAWHQRRILRQRQQTYRAPDKDEAYDPGYDDVLPSEPDLLRFRQSDTGNAKRFLALYWGFVRYSPERKEWLVWNGRCWKFSSILASWLATQTMILFAQQAGENYDKDLLRFATSSQNARRLSALLEVARTIPGIAIELSELDADPYLFNVANGCLDLRTQKLHRHRPEDLITKIVDVVYDPSAECPRWLRLLEEAVGPEMVRYLQTLFGLCLSADVRDKLFCIFYGPTNAGKTQILNAIRCLLGEYAGLLQIETLTSRSRGSNALADLAQLAGVRYVQSSELGADTALVTRIMKYLVQGAGSEIKGALKYGNPQRIKETWKAFIDCNDLPDLEDPDDTAFLDRVHPIRFHHSVSAEKMDKDLPSKLERERSGILSWMVRGFALRQAEGLKKHPIVVADLNRWREQSDNISAFVKDCCFGDAGSVQARPLYEAYQDWCGRSLKQPASPPVFARRMGQRYRKRKTEKGLFYEGLKLLQEL